MGALALNIFKDFAFIFYLSFIVTTFSANLPKHSKEESYRENLNLTNTDITNT